MAGFILGESETLLRLQGPGQFHEATLLLLRQTRRQLHMLTPDFEAERFNNADFRDALSAMARRSRYSEVRILLGDPRVAVQWGHQVVALAQRLPDQIKIRQLHDEDYQPEQAWMVADDIGLLRRDGLDGFIGLLSAKAIPEAQDKNRRFQEYWERAREIQDFRQLHI